MHSERDPENEEDQPKTIKDVSEGSEHESYIQQSMFFDPFSNLTHNEIYDTTPLALPFSPAGQIASSHPSIPASRCFHPLVIPRA